MVQNEDEILEKLCKEREVDYQIAKELKAKIFPLLDEAHRRNGYRFNKALVEQNKGMVIRLANSAMNLLLLKKLSPQDFPVKERKIFALHLEFLTLFEGFLATQINFLVFTLIANGHNLPIRKCNCAVTLGDIEKASLSSKLDFLKKHGFKALISNKIDTTLRNSIAHLFYEINEDGTIKVGKKRVTEDNYNKLYDCLRNISYSLMLINQIYYSRFAFSSPPTKFKEIKCSCGYVNKVPVDIPTNVNEPLECTKCKKVIA